MLALLEWATDRPKSWRPIGTLPETQRAAELLAKRGVMRIRNAENQYLLKPVRWRLDMAKLTGPDPEKLAAITTALDG